MGDPLPSDSTGPTILVVDDTLESLRFVTAALEADGMTVLVARDGTAALMSIALVRPDLVIMDAMMPVMDGFETTRRIKADPHLAALPVIFMTGLTETKHIVRGLQSGGVDYVTKPVIVDELLARVRVHLGNARTTQGSQAALDASGRSLLAIDPAGAILWSTPGTRVILERHFAEETRRGVLIGTLLRLAESDDRSVFRYPVSGGRLEFVLLSRGTANEWLFRIADIAEGSEERLLALRHGLRFYSGSAAERPIARSVKSLEFPPARSTSIWNKSSKKWVSKTVHRQQRRRLKP